MAITSLDDMVAAFPGQQHNFFKVLTPQAVSGYFTLHRVTGTPGVATAGAPGTNGGIPTASGSIVPYTNPTGGDKTYLAGLSVSASQPGTLLVYDRVWENSGLSVTTTGAQSIASPVALTRFTSGIGVEAWLDVTTVLGANATAPTIVYTDTTPTGSNTGTAVGFVTTAAATRQFPFSLAAGDFGVTKIDSYTNVASKVSGALSLVLRKRLASVNVHQAGVGDTLDAFELGLVELADDTCLEFIWCASVTSTTNVHVNYVLIQG